MDYIDRYFDTIKNILDNILKNEKENIDMAAKAMVDSIEKGNALFVFGCSHAGILAEELFYRAGGLALMNPIFNPTMMLNTRPVTLTSKMERLHEFGKIIIDESPLKKGDVILIHSVSGRNSATIDAALRAKEKGAKVIGLTNLNYSKNVSSRHNSGKNLYEICDIVIDNCGDFEDASIKFDEMGQKVGPTSTAVGATIVNSIIIRVCEIILEKGNKPPVFHSANVDGGDEFNKTIFKLYKNSIHYL
ncbi:SIS domain-containing protein [Clostridium oceanicum]|uniref:SIS domain-containing protein n=1 Tax=Clostridium oceanicum TaxID=1543 RepID=A0ABP3UK21_9CLOT